jgi:hypothetical protein
MGIARTRLGIESGTLRIQLELPSNEPVRAVAIIFRRWQGRESSEIRR